MSDTEDSDAKNFIPPEILKVASIATRSGLPSKSKHLYIQCYDAFIAWRKLKKTKSCDKRVFLAYFLELSKTYSSATLWSKYSMLRAMLNIEDNVDIGNFVKLRNFLKKSHTGYRPKKANVFSAGDISKFLDEAPNNKYLPTKVALILGVIGACRRDELHKLTIANVKTNDSVLIVNIPETKTHIQRSFTVEGKYFETIKQYIDCRPANSKVDSFFLSYRNQKCTKQPIGKNIIGKMPENIAQFLKLPDVTSFTGHSFRRTGATLLADTGAGITTLKRLGGWRSTNVAEGYIQDSIANKRKISNQITDAIDRNTATNKKLKSNADGDNCTVKQNAFNFTFQFNNLNEATASASTSQSTN